jgi:hypothetical protein
MRIVQVTPSIFEAWDDADDRFFIFATLGSGVLRFDVIARLPDGTKGGTRGREFFDAMMAHFGAKVRVIEARWNRVRPVSTNLDLFNRATAAGLPPEQAALVATKTGQWADDCGFSQVKMVTLDPRYQIGNYDEVVVQFSK